MRPYRFGRWCVFCPSSCSFVLTFSQLREPRRHLLPAQFAVFSPCVPGCLPRRLDLRNRLLTYLLLRRSLSRAFSAESLPCQRMGLPTFPFTFFTIGALNSSLRRLSICSPVLRSLLLLRLRRLPTPQPKLPRPKRTQPLVMLESLGPGLVRRIRARSSPGISILGW